MQLVILAPPEPLQPGGRQVTPLADIVREVVARLDRAEHHWATSETDLTGELNQGADVLVIAAESVQERRLRRILALRPPPVVVVTRDPAAAALALRNLAVPEIVEPQADQIADAIRRSADTALLARVVKVAEVHARLSPPTREWMALTLSARPPYAQVNTAAKQVQRSAGTIDTHWNADVRHSSPKEWLQWIQLVRAVECRRGGPPGGRWPAS